ncbi:PilX N-terminal domain-containing pilus assembly protein [Rhodanobacter sp. OK091]|uniref:pilus assembly PilX family protein n=1 Tax=Rhodanobacter sp. OK091 TaxID=1881037 RepID=UPI00091006DD|nr:PilX N-terminal domain-containing pilus assembly protein [Rhodanobacter sp. OK091]SHL72923.1 Type II secretory pathway, pseudopilin PulG [Rhodanobacter sp. OK091]
MKTSPSRASQRGFTLVMTLIFLIIFMLFAISMVSSSMINTKVAANQQYRLEAGTVAQQGIEQVMSQPFIRVPITTTTFVKVDVNGDGKADFTAQVAPPVCLDSKVIPNAVLPKGDVCRTPNNPNGNLILPGPASSTSPTPAAPSMCSATQWDIQSAVTDPNNTAVAVTVHQGAAVQVPIGTACP